MPQPVIPLANNDTSVLLVHAPYPGRLKFSGLPTSLLYALAPFAQRLAERDSLHLLGYLDGQEYNHKQSFYEQFALQSKLPATRVVCILSMTAAVEETAKLVKILRCEAGDKTLLICGGPHEDDCDEKIAERLVGVDLSLAGEAEFVLDRLLDQYLAHNEKPRAFCERLLDFLGDPAGLPGHWKISSPWLKSPLNHASPLNVDALPVRPTFDRPISFSGFEAGRTLQVMISRGCVYGKCNFCGEATINARLMVARNFDFVEDLVRHHPGSGLYFQDSIFPPSRPVRELLLPMLKDLGVEWGCQVFLGTLKERFLEELVYAGCRYIYTGIESGADSVLDTIGKSKLRVEQIIRMIELAGQLDLRVGLSIIFGALSLSGKLIETEETLQATLDLAAAISETGTEIVGFYPNVETVLPGTPLARGLQCAGLKFDFYRIPRAPVFDELEDGGVGYNFLTIPGIASVDRKARLAELLVEAALQIQAYGSTTW